ncbi:MAG: ABC transporter permease [Anaerolineales bacterium]|nr:ABC transporter permease [Anaerolineales bacterium]
MKKTLFVLRNEMITAITRKSFMFTVFGIPLIGVLVFLGASVLKGDALSSLGVGGSSGDPDTPELQVEGYVDHSGLIEAIHESVPQGILVAYPDEARARRALNDGDIAAYYIIPAGYVESGELIYINPDYNWASSQGQAWVMRQTLTANLLDNEPDRIQRFWNVMDVEVKALAPSQKRDLDNPMTFALPYATMLLLYLVILMSSSLLLNSVTVEKQNQVLEILMLSVRPRQLLTGKIVGLGITGLLQTLIWFGTGYTLLRLGGRTFDLPPGFELPPSILVWGIVFFLLGYAVYASLMAALGALVPNLKEASQSTILVIWPTIVPMFLMPIMIGEPHGTIATVLSLFPLTAPMTMMLRLAAGGVPWWQPPLAVGLLLITVYFILRAVAGVFRAQHLLSGQPFSVKLFFGALLGRA